MNEELVKRLNAYSAEHEHHGGITAEAADAIEELSKRIGRTVELYNRGVERSAMYEALMGIAPEPPKEET